MLREKRFDSIKESVPVSLITMYVLISKNDFPSTTGRTEIRGALRASVEIAGLVSRRVGPKENKENNKTFVLFASSLDSVESINRRVARVGLALAFNRHHRLILIVDCACDRSSGCVTMIWNKSTKRNVRFPLFAISRA